MPTDPMPIACNLTGLSAAERERRAALERDFCDAMQGVTELPDGYEILVDGRTMPGPVLQEFLGFERRCCPFFVLDLTPAGKDHRLRITGGERVKEFVAAQFQLRTG